MRNFRETLWFKKGGEPKAEAEVEETPVELPIEDRYLDDNTVSRDDSKLFSVRTGSTEYMRPFKLEPAPDGVEMVALVGEMHGGRNRTIGLICAAMMFACAFLIGYAA